MKTGSRILAVLCSAAIMLCAPIPASVPAAAAEMAHDPSRNVNAEGVGNPFNFGERNTPANASIEEIRAINHKMTVQEVKYALYKEIDEHWDLISVRLGQTDREKVYALFLGVGTRESTLGGNGDGADIETAQGQGFGVSSAHAYGTLQTAVTAFQDPGSSFMQEDDVPEMEWYALTKENFYDAIISNHMGIRKILHFVRSAMVDYNLTGWQVVRAALKGHNTGWADYTGDDNGYYRGYPDECATLARYYYEEGHLYDNVFTWTDSDAAAPYRSMDVWTDWWYDKEPSLDPIPEHKETTTQPPVTTTQPETTVTASETTLSATTVSSETGSDVPAPMLGDVNCDKQVTVSDAILTARIVAEDATAKVTEQGMRNADMNQNGAPDAEDTVLILKQLAGIAS